MVKEARLKLNSDIVEFEIGDINKLEFEANTFNRCRIDGTLQHLADPVRALGELYRVLKPGGKMLAFDNDWETFTFAYPKKSMVRKVCNYWCDSFASGRIGSELYTIFKGLGLKEVQVYPRTLVVTDLSTADRVFDIFKTISKMEGLEIISTGESNDLKQKLQGLDNSGAFFSSYTGFMVVGSKAW